MYVSMHLNRYMYIPTKVCKRIFTPACMLLLLATVVEGDQKSPFSIATTPRCRGGCYSFPGLLHFTLDMNLILLSVKQGSIKYHF